MNLKMGSQSFSNVQIPLLWGERAIIQDANGRLSVIDLSNPEKAICEIIADEPAPDITFRPQEEGFVILNDGKEYYSYSPEKKTLTGITIGLPEIEIAAKHTRVGTNIFSGNVVSGYGVGLAVKPNGISMGAALPPKLAKLVF